MERAIIDSFQAMAGGMPPLPGGIIGDRNQTSSVTGHVVRVTDELGLSCDPVHFAKPNCKVCYGRGVLAVATKGVRGLDTCGCIVPRRERARAFLEGLIEETKHLALQEYLSQQQTAQTPPENPIG